MGASSSGLPLWKTLGLSHWWAGIQQNRHSWGPACPCLAMGTLFSPAPSHAQQGISPGRCRAQKQLPELLAEEPR